MNATIQALGSLFLLSIAASCGTSPSGSSAASDDPLANCPVVGQYVQVGNDRVLSCDQQLLKDTVRIPLSYFAEDFELVKLDNRDEALVGQTGVTISDNYILAHSGYPPTAFKLFDRKTGAFIGDVGAVGQGPGEYQFVYDAQIDEEKGRIYLAPWQTDKLLIYDLKGKYTKHLQFYARLPKMKFQIDNEKGTLTIATLPWPKMPGFILQLDTLAKPIQKVTNVQTVTPNFNSEVINDRNCPGVFDVSIYSMDPPRVDSLYHYDAEQNRLVPVFTFNMTTTDPVPWHGYSEWPDYFTGNYSGPPVVRKTEHGTVSTPGETFHYIVDKATGKGAFLKIYNDYFGNLDMGYPSGLFRNGAYCQNIEPGNLLESIETALKDKTLSDAMRKRLTDLQADINENDNNYVLIYKLKDKNK